MPLNKTNMKTILKQNGHLRLEGDEETEDLRTALYFLRKHTYAECKRPDLGIPIESLIPDISALAPRATRIRNVQNVDTSKERL